MAWQIFKEKNFWMVINVLLLFFLLVIGDLFAFFMYLLFLVALYKMYAATRLLEECECGILEEKGDCEDCCCEDKESSEQ